MAYRVSVRLRMRVLDDGCWQCYICKCILHEWETPGVVKTGREATLDHLVPKCRGGRTDYHNLRACCFNCNNQKSDKSAKEFIADRKRKKKLNPDGVVLKSRYTQKAKGKRRKVFIQKRQDRYERKQERDRHG